MFEANETYYYSITKKVLLFWNMNHCILGWVYFPPFLTRCNNERPTAYTLFMQSQVFSLLSLSRWKHTFQNFEGAYWFSTTQFKTMLLYLCETFSFSSLIVVTLKFLKTDHRNAKFCKMSFLQTANITNTCTRSCIGTYTLLETFKIYLNNKSVIQFNLILSNCIICYF